MLTQTVVRIHLLCHKTLKSNNIHKTYRRKAEQIRTNNTNSNKIVVKCAKLCKSYKQRIKLCNDEKSKGKKQNLKRNLQRAHGIISNGGKKLWENRWGNKNCTPDEIKLTMTATKKAHAYK